ncbi:hypothetical protein Tco_1181967 [Tanacetum coccineum]
MLIVPLSIENNVPKAEIRKFLFSHVLYKTQRSSALADSEQNESSITFSPRSDPLHHEFAGEPLTLPARNDREFEEYLSLMTVLNEISTSQGNFHQNSVIESLPMSPILVEDSEPTQEEIDILLVPDNLIPPGVEDADSEDEVNESPNLDHQDDPSIPRPPPEPPDIEKCFEPKAGILIIKEFKGVSKSHDFMTSILPTLVSDLPFISSIVSFENEDTIFDPGIVTFLRADTYGESNDVLWISTTPATTLSSSLQNLPNFGSLFGFDNRLKALEDNFSEFKQTNQYAEALSSIPGIVDQYLANKMKEAVDVAVQLKSDRIREEAQAENQQFLDSIDEGMKKVIKEQVKNEVSKITPKIEKLVNEQLESEVLVRSSKEAKTSHAVAANLSELELKKILIDKMEANNSINRSDIQRQLYKALVDAYEADKILLDTYGDTVTIKRPRDGAYNDQEPSAGTDRGSKRRRSGKEPESTSAPREKTTTTTGNTTTGSKTHKQSASQSAPIEETMQSTDVWICQILQEISQKRTRERMSDQEAKEIKAEAREIMPQPSTAWSLYWSWMAAETPRVFRAVGQLIG